MMGWARLFEAGKSGASLAVTVEGLARLSLLAGRGGGRSDVVDLDVNSADARALGEALVLYADWVESSDNPDDAGPWP
jgi:hypothetical protein